MTVKKLSKVQQKILMDIHSGYLLINNLRTGLCWYGYPNRKISSHALEGLLLSKHVTNRLKWLPGGDDFAWVYQLTKKGEDAIAEMETVKSKGTEQHGS